MVIIVPETKRIAYLAKHGIDMADFEDGFSWDRSFTAPAHPSRTGRARKAYVGMMDGVTVVAIVSPLGRSPIHREHPSRQPQGASRP